MISFKRQFTLTVAIRVYVSHGKRMELFKCQSPMASRQFKRHAWVDIKNRLYQVQPVLNINIQFKGLRQDLTGLCQDRSCCSLQL